MFYTDKKLTDMKDDPNKLACLQGYFIADAYRVLDLVCIVFESEKRRYDLHIQSLFRFLSARGSVLFATTDIYREAGDGHFAKRENAETQFDLKLARIREKIIGSCVKAVSLSNCGDIAMRLLTKNGDMLRLEALCDCSCEGEELWRIIPDDKNAPHMVCYPNGCKEE